METDLQELISNGVTERRNVEYKQALPGTNDDARREFLADVSSFANTAGGHIIYGVTETGGVPDALPGFAIPDFDAEKLRLENSMRDGVSPRMPGIEVSERIALASDNSALVVRIPRSLLSPHMVTFKGLSKFYARNSAGKYQLDVSQLRSAFAFSSAVTDKIRDFRTDRIAKIAAGITPLKLIQGALVVFHVIPLTALESGQVFAANELSNAFPPGNAFPIYSDNAFAMQINFDGLVLFARFGDGQVSSYLQVYRNGILESTSAEILYGATEVPTEAPQVAPPIFLGLSHTMERPHGNYFSQGHVLGREILVLPEVMLETYDANVATTMKPEFDSIWNAAGSAESPFYEGAEWKGLTKFNPNLPLW